jgi:putative peptide zinc metalloprotease protein
MVAGPVTRALAGTLSASHWYRVAALRPRLREPLRLHVVAYRGEPWAVVEDPLNGRFNRFDTRSWWILRQLDGHTPLEKLWRDLLAQRPDDAPSQDELLALLGQLHALDLLAAGALADLPEQALRQRTQARQRWRQRYANPLSMRWNLGDPDRLLGAAARRLAPWLGRRGALLWLAWVLPAAVSVPLHWRELSQNFLERTLAFDNLWLMWLVWPAIKLLHEIGHGIACKRRGGAVHEMGLMLLLFTPVPYVDASSAWTFADKRDRMVVGAAGILVEMALAAGGFYLWLWLEPGVVRASAYDAAMLASVGTVVFNANPLLRYDGYFILADLLEMPNLGQRASRFWGWLVETRLLRRRTSASPVRSVREAFWFALYAPLSFVYRMVVTVSIALFVATHYAAVGIAIAVWSLVSNVGVPLLRSARWLGRLTSGPAPGGRRGAARGRVAAAAAALVLLLAWPLPHHTQVDGVLWPVEDSIVRAGEAGFVTATLARDGAEVRLAEAIVQLDDPALQAREQALSAREQAARARYDAVRLSDPVRAEPLRSALASETAQHEDLLRRLARLQVAAHAAGRLWLLDGGDLAGRHVRQGQVLGYVMTPFAPTVRVIADQWDAELIHRQARSAALRMPAAPQREWPVQVVRAVPAASNELPSPALGRGGGGDAVIDPRDSSGRHALQTHFEYELALPRDFPYRLLGTHVSVRIEHEPQALALRLWFAARRLFLSEFKA